jgi:hypothetical protein
LSNPWKKYIKWWNKKEKKKFLTVFLLVYHDPDPFIIGIMINYVINAPLSMYRYVRSGSLLAPVTDQQADG